MDFTEILGLVAAACTTISLIPQVVKTVKTKEAKSVSAGMYTLYTAGTALWLIYGLLSKNVPVIAANTIAVVLAAVILGYKIRELIKG